MSTEMLIIATAGVQTAVLLGVLGLMAMLFNSRMSSMDRRLDALAAQQRADHQHLVSLILQLKVKERETA